MKTFQQNKHLKKNYLKIIINWLEKNRIVPLIITILIAIAIFCFSSIPGGKISTGGISWLSIVYHFMAFFSFCFFFLITIKGNKEIKIKYILIAIIISIVYGILDEVHQLFVPFRSSGIEDIIINTLGIFSAIIIYFCIKRKELKSLLKKNDNLTIS